MIAFFRPRAAAVMSVALLAAVIAAVSWVVLHGGRTIRHADGGAVRAQTVVGTTTDASSTVAAVPTCGDKPVTSGPLATEVTVSPPGPSGMTTTGNSNGMVPADSNNPGMPTLSDTADHELPIGDQFLLSNLTFDASEPTTQILTADLYVVQHDHVVGRTRSPLSSDASQLPITPGTVMGYAMPWQDVPACDGSTLPPGSYQLIMVFTYSVDDDTGTPPYLLVSPPTDKDFS